MEAARERNPLVDSGDEAGWVIAARKGDQKAFAEIVRRYQRPIHRVAYGMTRNASDADDVAQETFVRAYQALDRFRVGEPLYPWLARIAVNLVYSLFRRRKRRPETPLEPMLEAGHQWATEDDPVEESARRERDERIEAAFSGLKPEHQSVLALRVVEGMSYDEIAKSLAVPIGTVMSRLSRARQELRARLDPSLREKT
jgi:RNA polymerase sigma-70 factor (ECF subfamily)